MMKQRILWALVMLFASLGLVRAADDQNNIKFTVPAGEGKTTVVFTGTGFGDNAHPTSSDDKNVDITVNSKTSVTLTITQTKKEQTITTQIGGNAVTGIKVTGKITKFDASGVSKESTIGKGLTSLEFPKDAGLTFIELRKDGNYVFPALAKLVCDENNLTFIPRMDKFPKMKKEGYQIGTQSPANLATLNPTGESVKDSKSGVELTSDLIKSGKTAVIYPEAKKSEVVYKNWRMKDKDGKYTIKADSYAHADPIAPAKHYFYESKGNVNYYLGESDFLCDAYIQGDDYYPGVVIKDVPVHVDAATFKMLKTTIDPAEGGTVVVYKGEVNEKNALTDNSEISSGDQLTVIATPNANYKLAKVEPLSGLTVKDAEAHTYTVNGSKDAQFKVTFVGEEQTISYEKEAQGGKVTVKYDSKVVEPNGKVPFNGELEIIPSAAADYKVGTITFNGTAVEKDADGKYIVKVVKGNNRIVCNFTSGLIRTIRFTRTIAYLQFISSNGVTFKSGTTDENGTAATAEQNNLKTYEYEAEKGKTIEFKLTYGEGWNSGVISEVRANSTPMTLTPIENGVLASTTMPDADVTLTVTTTTLRSLTINVVDKQTVVYTGKAQAPKYTVDPAVDGVETWYAGSDKKEAKGLPTNAGTYTIKFSRPADKTYAELKKNSKSVTFTIEAAAPKIEVVPEYKVVEKEGKFTYETTKEGKATFNGKTLTGKFEIMNSDKAITEVPTENQKKSHVVSVRFTALNADKGMDTNFATVTLSANALVGKDKLATYEVYIGKLGDATLALYNGTQLLADKEDAKITVAEGTVLTCKMTKPGYKESDLEVISLTLTGEENSEKLEVTNNQITVTKALRLGVKAKSSATKYEYTTELKLKTANKEESYTGKPIVYSKDDLVFTAKTLADGKETELKLSEKKDNAASFYNAFSITYKDAKGNAIPEPIQVGTYTAVVKYDAEAAGSTYTYKPFEGTLKIVVKKAIPEFGAAVKDLKATTIAIGQKLEQSHITGKANVAGHYEWVNPAHVPSKTDVEGYKYQVKFVPDDNVNYETVTLEEFLAVEVSDKAIITFAPIHGSIQVVNKKTGEEYVTGEAIEKGTELTITATPEAGYQLESLVVGGKSFSNGGTYTFGESSVEVKATFKQHVNKPIITFAPVNGVITVKDNTGKTYVSGDAVEEGTQLTITATPAKGYKFVSMNIGGRLYGVNSVSYVFGSSATYIYAEFESETPDPNRVVITFPSEEDCAGKGFRLSSYDAKSVAFGTEVKLLVYALTSDTSRVVVSVGSERIKRNADGTYSIKADADKLVSVALPDPSKIKVAVEQETKNAKGYVMGTVEVEGLAKDSTCYYKDEITLVAYPESGVTFGGWSDDRLVKNQLRTVVVEKALEIRPLFTGVPTGVESIEAVEVYGSTGAIVFRGIGEAHATVVSMDGRASRHELSGDSRVAVPAGIYGVILEQGNETKRMKVVVR